MNNNILKVALPAVVGILGQMLFEITDIFWVGKIGHKAVAAVGAAAFLEWTLYAIMTLTTTGCASLVARYIGAKAPSKIIQVIRESFWASILISLVVSICLYFLAADLFRFMGLDQETWPMANQYFVVLVIGFPILYILYLQSHIFNGYGDTKTSTIISLIIIVINIVLDPLLIFGYFHFPKLGIQGAAIASVFSQFLGVLLKGYILRRKGYIDKYKNIFHLSSFIHIKEIFSIGVPSAFTYAVWTTVFPMLTVIITKFGMAPLAGMNIANRLEGFPYAFCLGFSIAICTLVGQSYGRGDLKLIKQIVSRGLILITLFLVPLCLVFIFCPEILIKLINNDPQVIKNGAQYLRVIGYFEIFLGWELLFEGAFNGLGNTRPYMYIRIPLTFLRIPLAYFFSITLNWGVVGVWWSISFTTLLKGVALYLAFNSSYRKLTLFHIKSERLPW